MATLRWWVVTRRILDIARSCLELSQDSIQNPCRRSSLNLRHPGSPLRASPQRLPWYQKVSAGVGLLWEISARCVRKATLGALVVLVLGPHTLSQAVAQQGVTPARAIEIFQASRQALADWDASGVGDEPGVPAAAVLLRGSGMILGRGSSTTPGACIREALTRAMRDAQRGLGVPEDARLQERMRALGARVTLSLELAHQLTPFQPETLADATLEISPGIEGVAVRLGTRLDVTFPSTMLLRRTSPGWAYRSLVGRLGDNAAGGLRPVQELADDGFVFYRFGVTHLAQRDADTPPVFLKRGGRIIPTGEVNTRTLREMGDGLAGYLDRLRTSEIIGVGLRGTYNPTNDDYEPALASARQLALVSYALGRYARSGWGERGRAALAEELSNELLLYLGDRHRVRPLAGDATVAALVVLADGLGVGDAEDVRIRAMLDDAGATLDIALERPDLVPPPIRGLVAHALAVRGLRDGESLEGARAFVRMVFSETPPERLTGQMPWLGWAELALADGRVPAAVGLRQMRELVWTHQLQFADTASEAADLIGGIVFTRAKNPLPTWQTVRPLAFIATMLGDERLTEPAEVAKEISSLVRSLRFMRQLCVDESSGMLMPNPGRAMWGVRSALWDHRISPNACAMALLTVCESLESLDRIAKR